MTHLELMRSQSSSAADSRLPYVTGTRFANIAGDVAYEDVERRKQKTTDDLEPVVLKKKLADVLNGIVLAGFQVGDRICLARRQAAVLIAEGWACPVPPGQRRRTT